MRHESLMTELGQPAAAFSLSDTHGKVYSLEDFSESPALLVAFLCNHCPLVQHMLPAFVEFTAAYRDKGLATVAISSNDVEAYPEDSPEHMALLARKHKFSFPYLYDLEQTAARDFRAVCTPDFFLYNQERRLVYRGQFDRSRPTTEHVQGNGIPADGAEMRRAVDAVLAGEALPEDQMPGIGCSIKWRPGNEPAWS